MKYQTIKELRRQFEEINKDRKEKKEFYQFLIDLKESEGNENNI